MNIKSEMPENSMVEGSTISGMAKTGRGLVIPSDGVPTTAELVKAFSEKGPIGAGQAQTEPATLELPKVQPARQGRQRRTKKQAKEDTRVLVKVSVDQFGTVPGIYSHLWKGPDVVVLGMLDCSYMPPNLVQTGDGTLGCTLELDCIPGVKFGYLGQTFRDDSGGDNIILVKFKEKNNG